MTEGTNVFCRDRLVRFSHCDPAGIVFYPHYFVMFNGLVEDWFNHGLAINYADFITERRLGMPMVAIECNFRAPSKIGEVITLSLEIAHIGNSSLTLAIAATFGREVRLSARLTMVLTSLEDLRPMPIPGDFRARLLDFKEGRLADTGRPA